MGCAAAASGCNDAFSNDDILFLKSLPSKKQLEVSVDQASTTSSGLRAAGDPPPTPSQYYQMAVKAGTDLNGVTDFIVAILNVAESIPPTTRDLTNDQRVWGPFPGGKDPQNEYIITIQRIHTSTVIAGTFTSTKATVSEWYKYSVQGRPKGTATFGVLIYGEYAPNADSIDTGQGYILVNFDYGRVLNPSSTDMGLLLVGYDNRNDQRAVDAVPGTDLKTILKMPTNAYYYQIKPDGHGTFAFFAIGDVFHNNDGKVEDMVIYTKWDPDRRGRAIVDIKGGDVPPTIGQLVLVDCWDASFNTVFEATNVPVGIPTVGTPDACAPDLQDFSH
jgi:hypothetical protein